MKLKRMWPAICIWVLFIIFDVIMVASSGFFSGLFPSDKAFPYTIAMTAAGTLIMGILMFAFGKLTDNIDTKELSKTPFSKLIYVLMLITIMIGGIVNRYDVLARSTAAPSGKLSLYEKAMVGTFTVSDEQDLLSIVYSKILNSVLIFTGNRISFALIYQLALFMVFILLGAVSARLLMGKVASVVFAAYVAFMPVFSDNLRNVIIGTDEVFYVMIGIELFVISLYLKLDSDGLYKSTGYIFWYLFVGVVIGFMTYVDAGTGVVILPLLLSGLFIYKGSVVSEIFRLLVIIVGGVTTFFAMILQEGGVANFDVVLYNWSHYYFKNINTFNTFWTYTNYKIEYLVTFIVMTGVIVGFWRNRRYENISPWLLSTMIVFFVTPFFGATRTNSEMMLTVFFAFVVAAVAGLLAMESNENALLSEIDVNEEDEEPKPAIEQVAYPEHLVVRPENVNMPEKTDESAEEDEAEEVKTEEVETEEVVTEEVEESEKAENGEVSDDNVVAISDENDADYDDEPESDEYEAESKETDVEAKYTAESDDTVISDDTNNRSEEYFDSDDYYDSEPQDVVTKDEIHDSNTAFNGYTTRFVPEGMVLPVGAEDEMDLSESHMKMPVFNGMIGLNRDSEDENKDVNTEVNTEDNTEVAAPVIEEPVQEEKEDLLEKLLAEKLAKDKEAEETLRREQELQDALDEEEELQEAPEYEDEETIEGSQESKEEEVEKTPEIEPEEASGDDAHKTEEKPQRPARKYQYEFDIEFRPGDDFDI